jgi:sorbitol-specific phosphotransferase system component IIA
VKVTIPYRPRAVQSAMHRAMNRFRFTVIVAHRRCGKTVAVVNQLIRKALLCELDYPRYGYVAPFYGQAKEIAWDYLKHFTAPLPGVKVNQSDLSVTLPTGAKIKLYGADNPDSLRGTYFDGVVLDEVAQMKAEVWGEIVRPSLSDRNGWAVFIGTPKGINQFYDLYQQAIRDEQWGAEFFPVENTGVISDEELQAARSTMSEAQYRQEFGCDFSAAVEDVLISIDVVNRAIKRVYHPTAYHQSPVLLGVDVARFGDDKSVIIRRQGVVASISAEVKDYDLMKVADIVQQQIHKEQPSAVFIDVVGIGAGVVDRLRQLGHKIIAVNAGESPSNPGLYVNKRSEMWCLMRDWLVESGCVPDSKELRNDLVSLTYSFDSNSRYKLERKEDAKKRGVGSPDYGDALALTFAFPVAPGIGRMHGHEVEHTVDDSPLYFRQGNR